jgi:hypothetical protein
MVSLMSLWLPILLSAVAVFIASSLVHMLLRYHDSDFVKAPNEDTLLGAMRDLPPGDYRMPYTTREQLKDPAFVERVGQGPVVLFTVMGGGMQKAFKNSLILWFVYSLVVSLFAAYLTSRALDPGAPYLDVFRFAGTTAFLGYALAQAHESIWWGRRWSTTLKAMFDGLVYGLLTGGVFGWLWPR